MTKNEQNRVVAWRLKIIRQASELPRGVAQTCRHFGLSRKTFYKWRSIRFFDDPVLMPGVA
jgi:transposase-like protein